jgi:hypothetical protein
MRDSYKSKIGIVLPLPGFIFKPFTALIISAVHVYLSFGHLYHLFSGDILWTNIWKGFGALLGAYVFAALATRQLIRVKQQNI